MFFGMTALLGMTSLLGMTAAQIIIDKGQG
jgi:hypothetical protein